MNCPICHHDDSAVIRTETGPSLYQKPPSAYGAIFGAEPSDWENLRPEEWFHKHHDRFLSPLETIAAAKVPYRSLKDPPFHEGIYFLFNGDVLTYIGQAKIIAKRLVQHRYPNGRQHPPSSWFTHYAAIWVPLPFLDTVELYYLHLYVPPRNIDFPVLSGEAAEYLERVEE